MSSSELHIVTLSASLFHRRAIFPTNKLYNTFNMFGFVSIDPMRSISIARCFNWY